MLILRDLLTAESDLLSITWDVLNIKDKVSFLIIPLRATGE